MDNRLLLRVTAPAAAVGLLLLGVCLGGVVYVNRLQKNFANVLSRNVTSLQAAQELEIRVRQLRFHNLLYYLEPSAERLPPIAEDQERFEKALATARETADSDEEKACVRKIEVGYERYRVELADLRDVMVHKKSPLDLKQITEIHPIRHVVDPCQELLRLNRDALDQTAEESRATTFRGNLAMLLLGLAGPISGVVLGYGVARGLSRSIYRLSVKVQDAAQRLESDVASIDVVPDGDISRLDRQLQQIVAGVEQVVARLQQQQRELLRTEQLSAVGQLAAGIAHEIRNPLAGIKLLVESALASRNDKPLNIEDLRVIHQEVVRLEKTVQGFLDFARPPSPQLKRCDLRGIVNQAFDLVRARARQGRVELSLRGAESSAPVSVDAGQICTVLVNLLLNSLDAMPQGGRIDAQLENAGPSGVRLRVADTGPGIAPEILPRLFTPFVTSKATGTGLGLSISRRIIEEHGGRLSANNRPEGGACFEINLPGPAETVHAQAAAG